MQRTFRHARSVTIAALLGATALPVAAKGGEPQAPSPVVALKHACDAAGGLEAFRRLGTVKVELTREEITEDGHQTDSKSTIYFRAPGPIPGRLEIPASKVVAGDDGNGGWAVVGGRPDTRPATAIMHQRVIPTDLFPVLLPFSLTWEGASVTSVTAARVGDEPVWRLQVETTRSFFHSPQISTHWTVDLDRQTYAIVRAESPATDLGKGIRADGMRFAWTKDTTVGGVKLATEQHVIGLDEMGNENAHTRIDHVELTSLGTSATPDLFANPLPPEARPTPPAPQPPPGLGGGKGD